MIIASSSIQLNSQHQIEQLSQRQESLRVWHRSQQKQPAAADRTENRRARQAPERGRSLPDDTLKLSNSARQGAVSKTQTQDAELPTDAVNNLTLQIIRRLVKEITGRDFTLFSAADLQRSPDQIDAQAAQQPPQHRTATANSEGYGLIYQESTMRFESETSDFSAEGTIQTGDGQSLRFSMSLAMSHRFYSESTREVRTGDAAKIDPLVIHFDGDTAELSSSRFQFDINADGELDHIAGLKAGSGFLALDKNQDGQINDGSELFGPVSGNGFADLAAYDEDQNQFIDAGDTIYQQLRIWQCQDDGSQRLSTLADKKVGAIYLGNLSTPFQVKDSENRAQAEIAKSGFYLTENGEIGSVQQLNFVV